MKLEHLSTKSLSVICPELIPGALTPPLLACSVLVGLLLFVEKFLQPEPSEMVPKSFRAGIKECQSTDCAYLCGLSFCLEISLNQKSHKAETNLES